MKRTDVCAELEKQAAKKKTVGKWLSLRKAKNKKRVNKHDGNAVANNSCGVSGSN